MAITGKEADLAALLTPSLDTQIRAEIAAACGATPMSPECIMGLSAGISKGVANVIIAFLVANTAVGTSVVIPVTSAPGAPSAGTGTGVIT